MPWQTVEIDGQMWEEPQIDSRRLLISLFFNAEDVGWAFETVTCESRWNSLAANPGSTARGWWQFLRGTWNWVGVSELGLDPWPDGPYDPWQATRAAAWLFYNRGPQHWPVCGR